jgi:glycolate oxidase FAD binding subunit
VFTARAGTPLAEVEQALAEQGQMLPFDPPRYGIGSTIGGVVASGLSGPLSFGYGPLRHYVLGAHLLDAQGRVLKFGGEVMKNVAGYDVSRLLTGSLGMFGVIVQVSIKVMPIPTCDVTQVFHLSMADALAQCNGLRSKPLPVKAAAWLPAGPGVTEGVLAIRLCGAQSAVNSAIQVLGGQTMPAEEAGIWWQQFRDHEAAFFKDRPLWRIAVRAQTPDLGLGPCAFDLGAELRWVVSALSAEQARQSATAAGGHATLFRPAADGVLPADGVFQPLAPATRSIVKRLKQEFDPKSIFNPGRLVAGI